MLSFVAVAARPMPAAPAAERQRLVLVGNETSSGVSRQHLEARGYDLVQVPDLAAARRWFDQGAVDLIILEAARDPARLLDHCRALAGPGRRLIVIHAPADQALAIEALEAGADDCLPARHNARELVARVRAVLRRHPKEPAHGGRRFLTFDQLALDVVRHELHGPDGARAVITPHQFRLLKALLARWGEVVPRDELFDIVQGEASESFDRAVDVHVSRLRKRLMELTGRDLITAYRGVGYRLNVQLRPTL